VYVETGDDIQNLPQCASLPQVMVPAYAHAYYRCDLRENRRRNAVHNYCGQRRDNTQYFRKRTMGIQYEALVLVGRCNLEFGKERVMMEMEPVESEG
jgi:hypothetical protein